MNTDWQLRQLGDMCNVFNGGTPKTSVQEYWEGNHLWITPAEMGKRLSPYVSDTERKITDKGLRNSSAQMLPSNSVILSSRAPIGHLVINTKLMATNQGCKGLVPNKELHYKYLYYYLSSIVDILNSLGSGTTFKELSGSKLKEVTIPVPPFSEQVRIVAILDGAFIAIAKAKENAQKNLQNAREIFESYSQSVFTNSHEGWKKMKLEEVCDVIGGGTPSKANKRFYDGNIYWATVRDMKEEIIKDTEHKITKDAVKNSSTNIIPKGNVVIATRVGLGKVCLIENDTAINQDLRGVVPINLNILSVAFLYRWFKSIAHLIVQEGTGATVQGVKLPFIKSLLIPIPSLKEQQDIVFKFDALSVETKRLEAIYQKKLADLEELKKSILQKSFKGELAEALV